MQVLIISPDYTSMEYFATKVKVRLQSGEAEFYEQHQELVGKINNDLVQVERTFENKVETSSFVIQEGAVIVTTPDKGEENTDSPNPSNKTYIYIYSKKALPINSLPDTIDSITSTSDKVKALLAKAQEAAGSETNSNILMLQEDVAFFTKALKLAKDLKA